MEDINYTHNNLSVYNDSVNYSKVYNMDSNYYNNHYKEPTILELFLDIMRLYYTPTLIAVGVVGNSVSCIVLLLSKLRKFSSSHYLACIVLTNTLYLGVLLLIWMVQLGINTYHRPFMCQQLSFVKEVATFLSLWITVAFVVDRYIAICWPTEAARFCTVMRARIVIAAFTIFSIAIYLNTSLTVAVVLVNGKHPRCTPLDLNDKSMVIFDALDMILNHILAYFSMCVLFILICRNIFCCNSDDLRLGDKTSPQQSLLTLVYISWFIISHIPAEIMYLHLTSVEVFQIDTKMPRAYLYTFDIVEHISNTALATNLFLFMAVHPLFLKYFKDGCGKCMGHFRKCIAGKTDKSHIEEQISLQNASNV